MTGWTWRTADILAAQARERPEAEAIIAPDARWSWAELARQTRRRAAAMHTLGLRRGDRVALLLPNGAEWVALFLAAASLGCVTIPINTPSVPKFKYKSPGMVMACDEGSSPGRVVT